MAARRSRSRRTGRSAALPGGDGMRPGRHDLRIALVSEHASPLASIGDVDAGGQNVHVAALAAALARRGHDVEVVTRRDDPMLPRVVWTSDGYAVRHVDAGPAAHVPKDALLPYMPAFSRQLVSAWSRDLPDVAHAHFWMSGLATLGAARSVGIPVVQTFHALGTVKRRYQGDDDTSPSLRIATERMLTRRADRILATCSDEVFELRRMGLDTDRVDTVPCGVDLAHFAPATADHRDPHGVMRVLTVSRLVPRKGVDDAIRAVAAVPGTELLIAGGPAAGRLAEDPEVARLRALARALGADDRVRFLGAVPRAEVPDLMRSAHALLALPWYEPFGITPIEAAACGIPVIATAVGGMTDTVVHEVTGLHVPPRDAVAAARALRRLRDDEVLRTRLGRDAAARASRRYGWDRVAELTEATYHRAMGAMPEATRAPVASVRGSA